jgi:hypothetical protein
MKTARGNILLNSTLAFIAAFILTTVFHEFGHFISYLAFGAHPELYHNNVQIPAQTLGILPKIISALAGPVFSLIQGIIFAVILLGKQQNDDKRLLFLWLSLFGFINFFGYLMLTAFSSVGDTGIVAELLHLPDFIRILISIMGISVLIMLVFRQAKFFSDFIPAGIPVSARRKYINSIMSYPILIGSMVNTILAFPIPVILSAIYPATSAFVVMSAYGRVLKTEKSSLGKSFVETHKSVFLMVLTVGLILLNRLLTRGVG